MLCVDMISIQLLKVKLQMVQDENDHLVNYIDQVLTTIMENHSELLEVGKNHL